MGRRRLLDTVGGIAARFSLRTRDVVLASLVVAVTVGCALALLIEAAAAMAEVERLSGQSLGMLGHVLAAMHRWLPLWLIDWAAYPLLATALGIGLAQGSATNAGLVDYRLGRVYDELSERGWREYSAHFPEAAKQLARDLSALLREFQQQQFALALGRRAALSAANRLRVLAAADGEQTPGELLDTAAHIEESLGVRRLVATLPEAGDALVRDQPYEMRLQFEPSRPSGYEATPEPTPRDEMAGESRRGRAVLLHLFGDGLAVAPGRVVVDLPYEGASTVASVKVVAKSAPRCVLQIQVTEARGVKLLQSLRLELPVSPPATYG